MTFRRFKDIVLYVLLAHRFLIEAAVYAEQRRLTKERDFQQWFDGILKGDQIA